MEPGDCGMRWADACTAPKKWQSAVKTLHDVFVPDVGGLHLAAADDTEITEDADPLQSARRGKRACSLFPKSLNGKDPL